MNVYDYMIFPPKLNAAQSKTGLVNILGRPGSDNNKIKRLVDR